MKINITLKFAKFLLNNQVLLRKRSQGIFFWKMKGSGFWQHWPCFSFQVRTRTSLAGFSLQSGLINTKLCKKPTLQAQHY